MGARVIGVTSSEEKAEAVKRYADRVIVGTKFSEEAKREEINVVVDTVGTPTFEESLRSLWLGGRVVQIGNVDPSQLTQLRLGYMILKDLVLILSLLHQEDAEGALRLTAEGKITPVVAGTVTLEDIERGYELLKDKRKIGKVLVKP